MAGGDPGFGDLYVGGVNIITNIFSLGLQSRKRGGATADEGVKNDIAFEGIELNQATRQFNRKRRRVFLSSKKDTFVSYIVEMQAGHRFITFQNKYAIILKIKFS